MMSAPAKAALAALFALLTACSVGSVDGPGTPDAAPSGNELSFTTTMKPVVMRCVGCHGNGGSQPNLTSYSTLMAKYTAKPGNTNVLVTKGDHAGIVYFSAADKTTVENWINSLQ
ncbi:MAG TPA: hypothetical protein VNO30_13200 [Kofleriaceae bacterium]|nr:hypothetical protein [Kofleriaceae bacterium]